MKHARTLPAACRLGAIAGALALLALPASPAPAALRPTGDLLERFGADPRADARWFQSGAWDWDPRGTTFAFAGGGAGMSVWTPESHFTGTVGLRLRLVERRGGAPPRARLLFAFDPATGSHRWLEVAPGNPGRLTLGQTGTIRGAAPGVLQSWRTPVAAGAWLGLSLRIAGDKSVTVSFQGSDLFTAAAAPLAPGRIGFAAEGEVEFDEFSFTADPDGEPCVECHAGQPAAPGAADVYAWWDGRRWDALHGTGSLDQEGGHGDPGGRAAVGCTGANGCHDMREPRPGDHRNGTREGHRNGTLEPPAPRTVNAFHLRSAAIVGAPSSPWSAQLALDGFCLQCHASRNVPTDPHHGDADPAFGAVQLGQESSRMSGVLLELPVDSDVTTRALVTPPDFAPCISCHNPHGSGAPSGAWTTNEMLRLERSGALCLACHV